MHFSVLGPDGVAEIVNKRAETLHLLRVRILMGPVHKGKFLPEIVLRNGLIGHEHKILNDPGGRVPLIRLYINRPPVIIQHNLALRKIEVNGPPLPPFCPQNVRQLFHGPEHGRKLPVLLHKRLILAGHNGVDLPVAHAPVHPDHRLRHLMAQQVALVVNLHDAA